MRASRPIPTDVDLASYVAGRYRETPSGCWEFTGSIDANGRPRVSIRQARFYAYRIAYAAWVAPIPDGLMICHHCDNPICINPAHLYAGTMLENMSDAVRRGRLESRRRKSGTDHHAAVLTAEQVVEIATSYAARGATQAQLAAQYGVSERVVHDVVIGTSYPDVERPVTRRGVGRHLRRQPCGTRAGGDTHRREGTPPCPECREANRAYMYAYKANRRVGAA